MPELPDLQVYSENLKKRILAKNILSVKVFNSRKIDTPNIFRNKLSGTYIEEIIRNGKELFFKLENLNSFSVHLMLNGKFFLCGKDGTKTQAIQVSEGEDSPMEEIKGKIAAIEFEDAPALVIADFQGLCKISLNPKTPVTPDAMSSKFTFEYFSGVINKNAPKNVKALLIDQHAVRGIGNAYVDEILWKAGISPESAAGKIPKEKLKDLYEAIPLVFNDAIENILRISPDIISGEERSFLRVHNPHKKVTDEGDKIIVKTVAAKTTYFTERQKLYL